MAEYIEREAYKQMVKDIPMWGSVAAMMVDCIPAADVVEVVRCCDCVWYNNRMCYHPRFEEVCEIPPAMLDFDYCRYGARMDVE